MMFYLETSNVRNYETNLHFSSHHLYLRNTFHTIMAVFKIVLADYKSWLQSQHYVLKSPSGTQQPFKQIVFEKVCPLKHNTLHTDQTVYIDLLCYDAVIQNGISVKLPNVITSPQRHRRVQLFRKQKHRRNDQSRPQRFPVLRHANRSGPS